MNARKHSFHRSHCSAFSLIEVVLAIGILGLAIVGLIGVLGPLLANAGRAEQLTRAIQVMGAVDTYLQAEGKSNRVRHFSDIYEWMEGSFSDEPSKPRKSLLAMVDASGASHVVEAEDAGAIIAEIFDRDDFSSAERNRDTSYFQVVLSPNDMHKEDFFAMPSDPNSYLRGVIAIDVRIYAMPEIDPLSDEFSAVLEDDDWDRLQTRDLLLTFPVAVNR